MCRRIRCDVESSKGFGFRGELNKALSLKQVVSCDHIPGHCLLIDRQLHAKGHGHCARQGASTMHAASDSCQASMAVTWACRYRYHSKQAASPSGAVRVSLSIPESLRARRYCYRHEHAGLGPADNILAHPPTSENEELAGPCLVEAVNR